MESMWVRVPPLAFRALTYDQISEIQNRLQDTNIKVIKSMNIYSTQRSLVVLHNNRRANINFEGTGTIPSTWKAQICKYSGDDAIKGRWDDIKHFKPEHTYKDKNIIIKIGMSSVYDEITPAIFVTKL